MNLLSFCALFCLFSSPASWAVGAVSGDPTCAKDTISLRKGPGPKFPVSWKASRFMPFLKVEAKSGWVRVVDLEGESHWAPRKDLSSGSHCVVVKSAAAPLRQEPSASAALAEIKSVDRYTAFKKLESKQEWIKVEDEAGHQAWIHESNVWKAVRVTAVNF